MVTLLRINWEAFTAIASCCTAVVSVVAACYAKQQYNSQSKHTREATRSKILEDYNWHFMTSNSIKVVIKSLLDNDYSNLHAYDMEMFMRFYEELYLLIHSENRMKMEIARYMFSYYAIMAWDSESFWNRLSETTHENVDSIKGAEGWRMFRNFVEEMRTVNVEYITI